MKDFYVELSENELASMSQSYIDIGAFRESKATMHSAFPPSLFELGE